MGRILDNWRVILASFFSTVVIIGAYLITSIGSPPIVQASPEAALLAAIAAKDSDGDGLNDWEEALYGADPQITDTFALGMNDGEAVGKGLIVPKAITDLPLTAPVQSLGAAGLPEPTKEGTLTDAFAKNFFALYVTAKQEKGGAELTQEEVDALQLETLSLLASSVLPAPQYKSFDDLTILVSDATTFIAFAEQAEAVLRKNTSNASKSELLYLQDALEKNDAEAVTILASIAKVYREGAAGLAALPVPGKLAAADHALINAMMKVSEVVNDFARVHADPLAAMLALQQYLPASRALADALTALGEEYAVAGVAIAPGKPGASLVNMMANL